MEIKEIEKALTNITQHLLELPSKVTLRKYTKSTVLKSYTTFVYELWLVVKGKKPELLHSYEITLPNGKVELADSMYFNSLISAIWKGEIQIKL